MKAFFPIVIGIQDAFFVAEELFSLRMLFNDIINQQDVKHKLVDLVQHNRLSHALLFLGKEGSGALALALALAQYLVCEKVSGPQSTVHGPQSTVPSLLFQEISLPWTVDRGPLTDSCGICPGCIKAQQLIHPDIHFAYPVVTKKTNTPPISTDYISEWREFIKDQLYGNIFDWLQFIEAENKQGNITALECQDIIRKLNLKSFEGEYKILIIWMPEYLGNEGNKLLKLIEEPAANTLIILVAENENLILPTILSRCQVIKIPSLSSKDISDTLIRQNNSDAVTAGQVAAISEGNYREALRLIKHGEDDPVNIDWQAQLRNWLNAILKTGPVAQVKWVEEAAFLGREKQKQFLLYFNHLLGEAIRLRVTGKSTIPDGKERDFAERLNKIASLEQQQAIVEELDRAVYYIERNANSKILFHALTIKLYHIIKDKIVFLTG